MNNLISMRKIENNADMYSLYCSYTRYSLKIKENRYKRKYLTKSIFITIVQFHGNAIE